MYNEVSHSENWLPVPILETSGMCWDKVARDLFFEYSHIIADICSSAQFDKMSGLSHKQSCHLTVMLSSRSRIGTGNTKHHYGHRCLGARSAPGHQWPQWRFMPSVTYSLENLLEIFKIISEPYYHKQTTSQYLVCFSAIIGMLRVKRKRLSLRQSPVCLAKSPPFRPLIFRRPTRPARFD